MIDRGGVRRPGPDRRVRGRARLPAVVAVLLAGLVLGACSGLGASSSPASSATPIASGDVTSAPGATTWPTMVVEGTVGLATADASFKQMNTDVANVVNSGNPQTMLTVMGDALKFLKANRDSITALQGYDATKDTGDKLAAAYDQMIGGAQAIVDGLTSGNGEAVQQGFNDFFAGDAAYAAVTGPLGDLAAQAILMKRHFNQ